MQMSSFHTPTPADESFFIFYNISEKVQDFYILYKTSPETLPLIVDFPDRLGEIIQFFYDGLTKFTL